jgi:hypothetical protein
MMTSAEGDVRADPRPSGHCGRAPVAQGEDLEVRVARELLERARAEGVSLVGPVPLVIPRDRAGKFDEGGQA